MGLYLAGRGSYSFGYIDENGETKHKRIVPRQNVEEMGLPDIVIKQLKELRSGRNKVFLEFGAAAPPREAGYTSGSISMDHYKKASAETAEEYAPDKGDWKDSTDSPESSKGPHVVVRPAVEGEEQAVEVRPAYAPNVEETDEDPNTSDRATPRPGEWEPEVAASEVYGRPVREAAERGVPRQQEWADPTDRDGFTNMPEPSGLADKADESKEAEKAAAAEAKAAVEGDDKPKAKAKGKKSPKD